MKSWHVVVIAIVAYLVASKFGVLGKFGAPGEMVLSKVGL